MSEWVLDFLRHGEVDVPDGRVYGRTDVPLTARGEAQMWQSLRRIELPDWVLSSPLQRCYRVAEQFAHNTQRPLYSSAAWQEADLGQWEGCNWDDVNHRQLWRPGRAVHGGESVQVFYERVRRGLLKLVQSRPAGHGLVITHAGVIRCVVAHAMRIPYSGLESVFGALRIPHASVTRVRVWHDGEIMPTMQVEGLGDIDKRSQS